ncbi:hypothetical protein LMG28690_06371 [Paraburkholderia caffeinilytica]|nr:hypothetical protein LMG28690_06371 [Paraburkholderia caffeinilytica]
MTHGDPSIGGVGDPETNRILPDVGASNALQRAIFVWSLRFPSLSGRFIARSGRCHRMGGLFLSGGGGYRPTICNDRAMLRSRMAARASNLWVSRLDNPVHKLAMNWTISSN